MLYAEYKVNRRNSSLVYARRAEIKSILKRWSLKFIYSVIQFFGLNINFNISILIQDDKIQWYIETSRSSKLADFFKLDACVFIVLRWVVRRPNSHFFNHWMHHACIEISAGKVMKLRNMNRTNCRRKLYFLYTKV